jgi:outer membrane protein TolC
MLSAVSWLAAVSAASATSMEYNVMKIFKITQAALIIFASTWGASALLGAGPESLRTPPAPLPQPLMLDAALAYAMEHNPSLLRVKDEIREQEGVVIETRAKAIPTVGVQGQISHQTDSLLETFSGFKIGNQNTWQVAVVARQSLYSGGKVSSSVRRDKESLEAVKMKYFAATEDTLVQVRQAFYSVLASRELIAVHQEALDVLQHELTNATDRRKAGKGSDFDVLRADVAVSNARPALIRAQNTYRVSLDELRQALGAPSDSIGGDLAVEGKLDTPPFERSLTDVLSAARAHRPEFEQRQRAIRAAEESITVARSDAYPNLSAFGNYQWHKSAFTSAELDGWVLGVDAQWAIFDGHATTGRVVQARARLSGAQHEREELTLAIDVQVHKAFSALTEAQQLRESSQRVIEQAQRSLQLAEDRFHAGVATQLDVLQAQSALTEARSNFTQAQYDYAVAVARIQRASGEDPALQLSH